VGKYLIILTFKANFDKIDVLMRYLELESPVRHTYALGRKVEAKQPLAMAVVTAVAQDYNLTPEEILSSSRRADVAQARHVAAYVLSVSDPDITYRTIALTLGRDDHTTALNSIKRVEELIAADPVLKERIAEMTLQFSTQVA
jgi:chromosomal replication initiation ATPase DnaA